MTPRQLPEADRSGEVLAGKYRVVRPIGEGGMGRIYEAEHVVVGRRFAVKFLHRHLAESEAALARFRREARAAGALENEHIAAVVDFDSASDGAPFMVMEYLAGESLAELLAREGTLPVPRVASALLQVCRGLAAAHAAGIVHRDLKPDNLFLVKRADGTELVKIVDFGIAKLTLPESGSLTHTGGTMGTPFYMAPEQARGDKSIDQRADVYALGVIMYEVLSGQKPHPGDSHNAILAHVLTAAPAPLAELRPSLPSELCKLVHRMLELDPNLRPGSAQDVGRELARFAGHEVVRANSQFSLNAASVSAPTLPTPDTHSVSVTVGDEGGRASTPASAPTVRHRHAVGAGAAVLTAVIGAVLLRSNVDPNPNRAPSQSTNVAASRAPSAPSSSPLPIVTTLPPPSALPSGLPTQPEPAARAVRTRPSNGKAPTAAAATPSAARAQVSSAAAPGASAQRARFDANNPYD